MSVIKSINSLLIMLSISCSVVFAGGVAIVDENKSEYLRLLENEFFVRVENQVAVVTSLHTFQNTTGNKVVIKYGFPLPESASATNLRYFINGSWRTATISTEPQDTTLPGGGEGSQPDIDLRNYLGDTPLYFEISDSLGVDSTLIVELTYVQLLDYELGEVQFSYPFNYELVQSEAVIKSELNFELFSTRSIESLEMMSHSGYEVIQNSGSSSLLYTENETVPNKNYNIEYTLSLDELGIFGFSTFQPDSTVPDNLGRGYFTFVAEPSPTESEVIDKIFTFVIDRSGSMSGNKIVQAKEAARFIVNNMNEGDLFNIIDFSSEVNSFKESHVDASIDNINDALALIETISATGGTNISGALDTAIRQFGVVNDSTANIIIFLTDGAATVGTTNTNDILQEVRTLINAQETELSLFTFGIGNGANRQLLSLLANENNGLSEFLENDFVEDRISNFFLRINNPVLINTGISFSNATVNEVYPETLPNLYIGQQMIVSGRYTESIPTTVSLLGEAFGKNISYQYDLLISDSLVVENQFLPKVWAKSKIEALFIQYYLLDPNSDEAESIKNEIVQISVDYNIITTFTSFQEEDISTSDELLVEPETDTPYAIELLGNYPNPFNPTTTIQFKVSNSYAGVVYIRIYNVLGQLVNILSINVNGAGTYEVVWNGVDLTGNTTSSGLYVYTIEFDDAILSGKMTLIK